MVLNRPVSARDPGEPISPELVMDPYASDDLTAGDRVAVVFDDGSGARRIEGEPVRFDACGGGTAFRGHNVLIDAGLDDAEDGRLRVETRVGGGVKVKLNRPGAGYNETIADTKIAGIFPADG